MRKSVLVTVPTIIADQDETKILHGHKVELRRFFLLMNVIDDALLEENIVG